MDTTKIELKKDSVATTENKVFQYTTIETRQPTDKPLVWTDFCNCELILTLVWPVTLFIILLLFYKKIKNVLDKIATRVGDGSSISVGPAGIAVGETMKGSITSENSGTRVSISLDSVKENETARKILSTLWYHQNAMDNTFTRLWTFRVTSSADFDMAASILQSLRLISVVYDTNQYVLTDNGMKYCKENANSLGDFTYLPRT